jgi:hypothetical protein
MNINEKTPTPSLAKKPIESPKQNTMTRRNFLKLGRDTALLGAGLVAERELSKISKRLGLNNEAEAAETREQYMPEIFKEMAKITKANELLRSPQFFNANTYSQVNALYQTFDDKNIQQSTAMAIKMIGYIDESDEQVPEKSLETIYQQGGYSLRNALDLFSQNFVTNSKEVDAKTLEKIIAGYEKCDEYYIKSAKHDKNPLKEKNRNLDKTFAGLIELNNSMTEISSWILTNGKGQEAMAVSAKFRVLIRKNVKIFEDRNLPADFGNGKIFYPNKDQVFSIISGLVHYDSPEGAEAFLKNNASVAFFSGEAVAYLNSTGKDDRKFADFLLAIGAIKRGAEGKFERVSNVPEVLISTVADHYVHENQHCEFSKKPDLIRNFVAIWNQQTSIELKTQLLDNVLDYGYIKLPPEERKILLHGRIDPNEIVAINKKLIEGTRVPDREDRLYTIMTEFFAHSTDNRTGRFNNPAFEILDAER